MAAPHWTVDDARIIGDVVLASLLAGGVRMIALKAFIEPVAAAIGRRGWSWLDRLLGDRLPDLPK
jgi:hypothetical protein